MLDKSLELIEGFAGKPPRGYVAPWWEMTKITADLLLENGIEYDHTHVHARLPALLCSHRRQLDQDRLHQDRRASG